MSIEILLVYPPITDPTCGCAALPALAGYIMEQTSHKVSCIDANLGAVKYLVSPNMVSQYLEAATIELDELRHGRNPDGLSELQRNMRITDLLLATTLAPEHPQVAAEILQNASHFYDYEDYYWATTVLQKFLAIITVPSLPRFYTNFSVRSDEEEVNFRNITRLLCDSTLEIITRPFSRYLYDQFIRHVCSSNFQAVGFSIGYPEQLPFAVQACRAIRTLSSEVVLIGGGTTISQLSRYGHTTAALEIVLKEFDVLVVGDGEMAIGALLDAIETGTSLNSVQNTICLNNAEYFIAPHHIDLKVLPTPAVQFLPLKDYLAPEPIVHYAPTRGCYWNRCTFCDFGPANDLPAAPWRTRPIDLVIKDLCRLRRYSRWIYFTVDAIAPSYLELLARGIIDAGLDIRWGAEIRLDTPRSKDYYKLLHDSGCVAVSVGFESGNQRILDLMNKGTNVKSMIKNIRALSDAGIGVQIMGFTGFPTETYEDALDTIQTLKSIRDSWIFCTIGKFILTNGSIIARNPEAFGLTSLHYSSNDDLKYRLSYKERNVSKCADSLVKIDELLKTLKFANQLDRPFVGGIDSFHSLLYIERFGSLIGDALQITLDIENIDLDLWVVCRGVLVDRKLWFSDFKRNEIEDGEYYIICHDQTVLCCGPKIAKVVKMLQNPIRIATFLEYIYQKDVVVRYLLYNVFLELVRMKLIFVISAPYKRKPQMTSFPDDFVEKLND